MAMKDIYGIVGITVYLGDDTLHASIANRHDIKLHLQLEYRDYIASAAGSQHMIYQL